MKTFDLHFTSFNYGEVASYVNVFSSKYYKSAKKLENLMVTPYGPLVRRGGSKLITLLDHQKLVKLQAFEDNGNSIVMEFYGGGNSGTVRFYINGTPEIQNGMPYSLTTPYASDEEIKNLCFAPDFSNRKYYIFSGKVAPQVLSFTKDYIFTLEDLNPKDGPYEDINKIPTTLALSKTGIVGEEILVSASADLFNILDCDKFLRIAHDSLWGYGKITDFIAKNQVKLMVLKPFNGTEATTDFRFGAWGGNNGYPALGAIFNGRLYCAKTPKDAYSIWVSNTLEYDNFAPTTLQTEDVTDDQGVVHSVSVDIVSYTNSFTGKVNDGKEIAWLAANKDSILNGAQEGIFAVAPLNLKKALSPYNFQVKKLSSQKSSSHAISTDVVTCYADFHKYDLYSVEILQNDVLFLNHINANCKHLFASPIQDILVLDYPFTALLVLLANGTLLGSTFALEQNNFNYAWYQYNLGGNAKILSMATTYNNEQAYVILHVARQQASKTQYSLEVIAFNNLPETYGGVSDNHYVDSYMERQIDHNIIQALQNFEGEKLAVISANKEVYYEEHVVKNGQIELQNSVHQQQVICGYNYTSCYQSPVLDTNSSTSTLGQLKKINALGVNLPHTLNVQIMLQDRQYLLNRDLPAIYAKEDNYYTFNVDCAWQQNPTFKVVQNTPYALTLDHFHINVAIK